MATDASSNGSSRLSEDHGVDGVEDGVVNLDVVLGHGSAVSLAALDGDGGAGHGGELGAVGHVLEAVGTLDDHAHHDAGEVGVLVELHLRLARVLAESLHGVVVGGEHGDGAGGLEDLTDSGGL